eukprot:CAMPEP_0184859938 /NCGR_PEP_ID=MMETSP0580-20130426/4896_1 /TAXON_ID=1118495 /ORGANISM="Dactyliosolen fragilissimus" /LENGTH=755 /DNA_ID=CAMNT_0027356835 /DNA_START=560 /DNA_END=2827 /DNA_ORIENTATION=+
MTIFVGGKGGVGKTTISSSLAVSLASNLESAMDVLVVSTDPAHSLGDALDFDLMGNTMTMEPIQMTDPLTGGRLYAMEVDAESALEGFKESLGAFDVSKLSDALGVPPDLLESLGLSELSSLVQNPPPGLDELVALSNVLDDPSIKSRFDVVVVDTAPTGHTLRMLALPEFLDGFLGKLLELRLKLSGLAGTLQMLLGGGGDAVRERAKSVDGALHKLESFRERMGNLRARMNDGDSTRFVVVTVPTKLSINESGRLMTELTKQGIKVEDIVVNQCVIDGENDKDENGTTTSTGTTSSNQDNAMMKYYQRRKAGQDRWIEQLQIAIEDVSSSEEYKSNGSEQIALTQVPFFDVELVGTPALAYLGQTVFSNNPAFQQLLSTESNTASTNANGFNDSQQKFIICGGKGGVGKTTTSSSLAVTLAAAGHDVALVSTDPAHSLGDAFDMSFQGGNLVNVPLIGVPPTDGSLSVLEIDPSKSLGEFKSLIDQLISGNANKNNMGNFNTNGDSTNMGLNNNADMGKTLKELSEIFDTLPAGTDEVVALAKVINLVKKGNYSRIVLDTAPTGHTLRMLSTPAFISELIERVLSIAQKINSNTMFKMMISSATGGEDLDSAAQAAKQALLSFQFQMYDLEDIFANAAQTEFVIVTIPTELAVRESVRLLNDLTFEAPEMPIKVRNIVINQILRDDGNDVPSFLHRVADGQRTSIQELRKVTAEMGMNIMITKVPYLDTEPRGVFGLKILAEELLREEEFIES